MGCLFGCGNQINCKRAKLNTSRFAPLDSLLDSKGTIHGFGGRQTNAALNRTS